MSFKFNPFTGTLDQTGGTATLAPHTHTISDVTGLQAALDAKLDVSGYQLEDGPDYQTTYVYVGLLKADGTWYIYRRDVTTFLREYASGSGSYAANWTGRAGLTYL